MEAVFTKVLTDTDVVYRMALPMNAFNRFKFPAKDVNHGYFMVTDSDQNQYKFCLAIRNKSDYPKPGGWLEFARYRGLKAGDEVTLCMQQDEVILYRQQDEVGAAHCRIEVKKEVKKTIRLFGTDICVA